MSSPSGRETPGHSSTAAHHIEATRLSLASFRPGCAAPRAGPWLAGRVGVFAHGERESIKAVRAAVRDRMSEQDELSLSGYWAYGQAEDRLQAEKREPVERIG